MAGVSDCFSIGSTVACTTCFKQNIEGEVLAFDPSTKMLVLSILLQNTIKKNRRIQTNWVSEIVQKYICSGGRAVGNQMAGRMAIRMVLTSKNVYYQLTLSGSAPPNVYSHKLVTFSEMADYPYRMPSNRLS